jgi:hypothetical protein
MRVWFLQADVTTANQTYVLLMINDFQASYLVFFAWPVINVSPLCSQNMEPSNVFAMVTPVACLISTTRS